MRPKHWRRTGSHYNSCEVCKHAHIGETTGLLYCQKHNFSFVNPKFSYRVCDDCKMEMSNGTLKPRTSHRGIEEAKREA